MPSSQRSNLEAQTAAPHCPTSIRVAVDGQIHDIVSKVADSRTKWIDVGCGTGRYRELLEAAGVLGGYTGVDLGLGEDRTWTEVNGVVVSLLKRDASDLRDLPAVYFDAAMSVMAFEHIVDDRLAITCIARILPPGAPFVLVVPAPAGRTVWGFRHCHRWYDERAIRELANEAGFTLHEIHPSGGFASWAVNSVWFLVPYLISKAITAGAYLLFLGRRDRALRHCPWLRTLLPAMQFWHCRYAAGRRLHDRLNRFLLAVDRVLPWPRLAWVGVLRLDDPFDEAVPAAATEAGTAQ